MLDKEELYEKIGRDYFIKRLLGSELPVLNDAERKQAEAAVADLASEDAGTRESALEILRRSGPKCAHILGKALQSGDAEARSRAWRLLSEWAEPR